MELQIIRCNKDAVLPIRATKDSAGLDISACVESPVTINPGEIAMIPSGLKLQVSRKDVVLLLFPRSGLASKHGITLANSVGVIDSDYTGEVAIPLINHGKEPFVVTNGMRVAQLLILTIEHTTLTEVNSFQHETERGSGGFGHSGL